MATRVGFRSVLSIIVLAALVGLVTETATASTLYWADKSGRVGAIDTQTRAVSTILQTTSDGYPDRGVLDLAVSSGSVYWTRERKKIGYAFRGSVGRAKLDGSCRTDPLFFVNKPAPARSNNYGLTGVALVGDRIFTAINDSAVNVASVDLSNPIARWLPSSSLGKDRVGDSSFSYFGTDGEFIYVAASGTGTGADETKAYLPYAALARIAPGTKQIVSPFLTTGSLAAPAEDTSISGMATDADWLYVLVAAVDYSTAPLPNPKYMIARVPRASGGSATPLLTLTSHGRSQRLTASDGYLYWTTGARSLSRVRTDGTGYEPKWLQLSRGEITALTAPTPGTSDPTRPCPVPAAVLASPRDTGNGYSHVVVKTTDIPDGGVVRLTWRRKDRPSTRPFRVGGASRPSEVTGGVARGNGPEVAGTWTATVRYETKVVGRRTMTVRALKKIR